MQRTRSTILPLLALAALSTACASGPRPRPQVEAGGEGLEAALASLRAEGLLEHVRVLSSDEFGGRAPGTEGEDLTVAYLSAELREAGLEPGNPDGTYVQEVPLVGYQSAPTAAFHAGGETLRPEFPGEYVAVSRRFVPEVLVEGSELVFVGYGVVAPEYGWDDFEGTDVRGKTLVFLVNDPPVPDPEDPERLDGAMFRGRAMTYYGRWTYKYEIASELGAAAALIVHETGPAGYPYEVVSGSWGRENFDVARADKNQDRVAVEGWLSLETAKRLFAAGGKDFEELKRSALSRDFRPVALGVSADLRVENTMREVRSRNVIGLRKGSLKPDEHVLYTAHWDHLGTDPDLPDPVFNGALDNASGTAALLEIARAFAGLEPPPERSILFLAVTAEEKGLLGSKHYAANPLHPLERTLAVINMDGMNPWGRTRDVVIVGHGNSTLDDVLTRRAAGQGRTVVPDPEPEKGYFYRSDHFEFAKLGVPALYADAGVDYVGRPDGWGVQKREEYTANDYHKPSDEVKADWDLSGAAEDARLFLLVGLDVANGSDWPEWKPGTEFRAIREEMLGR